MRQEQPRPPRRALGVPVVNEFEATPSGRPIGYQCWTTLDPGVARRYEPGAGSPAAGLR